MQRSVESCIRGSPQVLLYTSPVETLPWEAIVTAVWGKQHRIVSLQDVMGRKTNFIDVTTVLFPYENTSLVELPKVICSTPLKFYSRDCDSG